MQFDSRETIIIAILVLFLGRFINKKINILSFYNIPEPVTGGIVASLVFSFFYFLSDISFSFSLEQRDSLLVVFFTCIGLSSKFSTLLEGGKTLVILLIIAIIYLFIQNLTGMGVALLTNLDIQTGVLGGSVSLSGGHGTAIAWAPIFVDEYNITNAVEIGIACATFGLVLGGIIGGPIANYLIKKHKLTSSNIEKLSVGIKNEKKEQITVDSAYSVILVLCIAIGLGLELHKLTQFIGLRLPVFVSCLFAGILLTNTIPYIWKKLPWPSGTPALSLVADYCLGLFLSMSLMSLQLWTLVDLALPILLLLLAQVLVVSFFVVFVVFRLLGKNYDAAVISSGYAGLALGATPTAIANMTAVTKKYGSSPQAFIVIPLIGAFFIDIANALIIQTLLQWLS